jgi:very-short-patch-repair endonuclease
MSDEVTVDAAIMRLAADQHAMIATRQLEALGLSRAAILKRVRAGRLTPFRRGVYLVGPVVPPYGPVMAALLACPRTVASHWTAAWLHQLIANLGAVVHLISPTQRRPRDGLVIHRAQLAPHEIYEGHGLALTSPFRTLSDLRGTPVFEKAVWEADFRGLISDDEAEQLLGHRAPKADHEGERVLVDLLRQAGLPTPKTNVKIGRWEIDLYWPEHALAVELDDRSHRRRLRQERDGRKSAALARRGIELVRVEGDELCERPLEAVTRIAVALACAAAAA